MNQNYVLEFNHKHFDRSATRMSNRASGFSSDELISQRVNHLLFINKLTRRRAAEELGISHSAFNTKINGGSSWRADELAGLTDRFGVTFDFLFGRQPFEYAEPAERDTLRPPGATEAAEIAEADSR